MTEQLEIKTECSFAEWCSFFNVPFCDQKNYKNCRIFISYTKETGAEPCMPYLDIRR